MEITLHVLAPELAAAIQSLADAIVAAGCIPVEIPAKVQEDTTPTQELAAQVEMEAPPAEAKQQEAKEELKTNVVKLEDVRAKMAEVMEKGKREEVKNLLSEFGVNKLTALPKDKLGEFLARVEGL